MATATKSKSADSGDYAAHKERMAAASREMSYRGTDLWGIPFGPHHHRKDDCRLSLRSFCETYLSMRFNLGWSADHLKMISRLQTAILKGGLFVFAMPRGSGKTALSEAAAVWALIYGHRFYIVLVAASEPLAIKTLVSIKGELEQNDLLLCDFPEVCHPIAELRGEARLCNGQHIRGVKTRISWKYDQLILPTVAGSPASGSVVEVVGIEGGVRGSKHRRADGSVIRPDFVIPDDPQTDQSARSKLQVETRERIIEGAILRLAGPKVKMAAVMPLTVIEPNDLADRYLDKSIHPEWSSERAKMLYRMPEATDLWDQYDTVRRSGLEVDDDGEAGTEFYRANREAMDAGAVVGWEERDEPGCLSALQFAMNWYYGSRRSFMAEAQNDPMADMMDGQLPDLDPAAIASKFNGAPRGELSPEFSRLTAFIDVHSTVLFWCVCGWAEGFASGAVIDYGVFPRQNRPYFAADDARPALADLKELQGFDETARLYAGLQTLTDSLAAREFPRSTGEPQKLEMVLIDAGWKTDLVHQFCRQSPHSAILRPSMGHFIGPSTRPIGAWKKEMAQRNSIPGQPGWVMRINTEGRKGKTLMFDANAWKTFVADRILTPMGGRGCLTLFGKRAEEHRLFAAHLCAEYRVNKPGNDRWVEVWSEKPAGGDNHWLDCLTGCAVGASFLGLVWSASGTVEPRKKREPRSMKELFEAAQSKREATR